MELPYLTEIAESFGTLFHISLRGTRNMAEKAEKLRQSLNCGSTIITYRTFQKQKQTTSYKAASLVFPSPRDFAGKDFLK